MTFYCYLFTDPSRDEPIYVGKGKGARWTKHLVRKDKHPFTQRLQLMRTQGIQPKVSMLCENVSEDEALAAEAKAIALYGRKDLGKGPLLNLTDGGEKGSRGYKHSPEACAKIAAANVGSARYVKAAAALKGKPKSAAHRAKFAEAQQQMMAAMTQEQKKQWAEHLHTPEVRKKLKEKAQQRDPSAYAKAWATRKAKAAIGGSLD